MIIVDTVSAQRSVEGSGGERRSGHNKHKWGRIWSSHEHDGVHDCSSGASTSSARLLLRTPW